MHKSGQLVSPICMLRVIKVNGSYEMPIRCAVQFRRHQCICCGARAILEYDVIVHDNDVTFTLGPDEIGYKFRIPCDVCHACAIKGIVFDIKEFIALPGIVWIKPG